MHLLQGVIFCAVVGLRHRPLHRRGEWRSADVGQ